MLALVLSTDIFTISTFSIFRAFNSSIICSGSVAFQRPLRTIDLTLLHIGVNE